MMFPAGRMSLLILFDLTMVGSHSEGSHVSVANISGGCQQMFNQRMNHISGELLSDFIGSRSWSSISRGTALRILGVFAVVLLILA